jgi:hypothetical protein
MGKLSWFLAGAVAGLTAAAISKELEKPADERTWRGTVAGVPYNFNIPTRFEIAREYWNPGSDRILSPQAIGIGWGINFAALWHWIESTLGEPQLGSFEPAEGRERLER